MTLAVLIMAGGSGTRLWPISRRGRAKQFAAVVGGTSLLEQTYRRVRRCLPSAEVFVNVTAGSEHWVRRLLPELSAERLVVAPDDRDTLPTLGFATLAIERVFPDPTLLLVASDNLVRGDDALRQALQEAVDGAQRGPHLVSIGIAPTAPSTQYGYMRLGEPAPFGTASFYGRGYVEKPDLATARRLLERGEHDWNSGMFAWTARTFWEVMREFNPSAAEVFEQLRGEGESLSRDAMRATFNRLPRIDVDHGLLEHVGSCGPWRHVFVRADLDWDDIGNYEALGAHLDLDSLGNRVRGPVFATDTRGSILVSDGARRIEVRGLRDIIVVSDGADVLVASRASHPRVRELAARCLWNGVDSVDGRNNAFSGFVKCLDSGECVVQGAGDGVVALVEVANVRVTVEEGRLAVSAGSTDASGAPPWAASSSRSLPAGMRLHVLEHHDQMSECAAAHVVASLDSLIRGGRSPLVMFSAGSTPLAMFGLLRSKYRTAVDWSKVRVAQMDEYRDVQAEQAYSTLLRRELVEPLRVAEFMPIGTGWDVARLGDYERSIVRQGLDLVVHGIGANGHLAFNEPGSDFDGSCAISPLADITRERAAASFGGLSSVPLTGLTLGLGALNGAREVILMASSADKATALRDAVFGPVSGRVPASSLQTRAGVSVYADGHAAGAWLLNAAP